MWLNVYRAKKIKIVNIKGKQQVELPLLTNGVSWGNSSCLFLNSNLSTKKGNYAFSSTVKKINNNKYDLAFTTTNSKDLRESNYTLFNWDINTWEKLGTYIDNPYIINTVVEDLYLEFRFTIYEGTSIEVGNPDMLIDIKINENKIMTIRIPTMREKHTSINIVEDGLIDEIFYNRRTYAEYLDGYTKLYAFVKIKKINSFKLTTDINYFYTKKDCHKSMDLKVYIVGTSLTENVTDTPAIAFFNEA